jgi:hypothetical protein
MHAPFGPQSPLQQSALLEPRAAGAAELRAAEPRAGMVRATEVRVAEVWTRSAPPRRRRPVYTRNLCRYTAATLPAALPLVAGGAVIAFLYGMKAFSFILPGALLLLPSCAATVQSGGFTIGKDNQENAFEAVKARATFELECPKEKLELVVLATEVGGWGSAPYATQIGASGCSHKAVYVRTLSGGWAANSAGK